MAGPSDLEQLLLEYVNETRVDPLGSANRYLTSYAPLRASDPDIQSALSFFQVNGTALRDAFAGLTPAQPLAWNDNLAAAARTHSQLMIDQQRQEHVLPGEADVGDRVTAAGYTGWRTLNENIYAYSEDMLYAHAGFMVDWGNGPNGMQDPAGHRIAIMNRSLNEVGMGVLTETNPSTQIGPYVVTQDFGQRTSVGTYLLGVAYTDRDRNGFYSVGEGRGDLIVASGGRSATAFTSGGYQLSGFSGTGTATLTGGGLAGAVTLNFNAGGENVKADVIDGTTLKLWNAGTATVSGAIANVLLGGIEGARITLSGDMDRRLTGYDGNDTLVSGTAHDFVFGGGGADSIVGGGGNDHLYGRAASGGADGNDTIQGGDGADYVQGNAGSDVLSGGTGSDRIQGGADNDLIHGDDGNDVINGNLGNDEIHGDAGNDSLRGGQGNDAIAGGAGDDVIMGDLGDDRIAGGAGIDMLTGGAGADVFVFPAGGDAAFTLAGPMAGWTDVIADFANGTDRIDLDFGVQAVLQGQAGDLAGAVAAAQALMNGRFGDGEVAAVQVGDATYLLFNAIGGGTIDSAIRLAGVNAAVIDTGDFI